MSRKLLYYPHPTLRAKTHEVREFTDDLKQLTDEMRQIMHANNGMGLAAIQLGDLRRIIIVEYPGDKETRQPSIPFTVLINPKITNKGDRFDTLNEGCLSIPSVEVPIERATEVTVIAQDITGEALRVRAKGMFARILQHEIDHLNGILITDYAKEAPKATNTLKTMVWGSTQFTTQVLNTLNTNPALTISHIVTEAPKPSGRGKDVKPTIVRTYADALGISCLEPDDLKNERIISYLQAQQPDLIIVAAYGKLLPKEILAIPKYGCLNIHPSLLPKYRGATPIQAAILNGDQKSGVTVIKMSPEFDTGEMLAQSEIDLEPTDTYGDLEPITAELGAQIINQILPDYIAGKLQPIPQNEKLATYTKKIKPEDRWLNLADPAEVNERKMRAYSPSPSAFVLLDGQPLKILSAHIENKQLIFDTVQPAGKKIMSWEDFKRGYRKEIEFEPFQPKITPPEDL